MERKAHNVVEKLIEDKLSVWQAECESRFEQLRANEEENHGG